MGGQNQHLGNLHVLRRIGSIDSHVGNIIARKGFDALIDISSTVAVAVETDITEVGLYQSGLQVGHAHGSIGHIYTLPPA